MPRTGKVNKVLWNLREDREANCEEMSRLLGIKGGMWWDWEQDGTIPTEKNREMVAKFFGLTVEAIWPGRGLLRICTINGISHAKRKTGEFWCRRPYNETEESFGEWDDVTCKTCRTQKFDKYRNDVARKKAKEQRCDTK